jgi:hypothetical protein
VKLRHHYVVSCAGSDVTFPISNRLATFAACCNSREVISRASRPYADVCTQHSTDSTRRHSATDSRESGSRVCVQTVRTHRLCMSSVVVLVRFGKQRCEVSLVCFSITSRGDYVLRLTLCPRCEARARMPFAASFRLRL